MPAFRSVGPIPRVDQPGDGSPAVTAAGVTGNAEIHTGSRKVRLGEIEGSVIAAGTAARLEVTTGFGHGHNPARSCQHVRVCFVSV